MAPRLHFILLQTFSLWLASALVASDASIRTSLPTAPGTTWEYSASDEGATGGAAPPPPATIVQRLAGRETFNGDSVLKLETFSGNVRLKTELLSLDKVGLRCVARSDENGELVPLDPPELILPARLKRGTKWKSGGMVADVPMQEEWSVAGTENITVPAGRFHAVHLHYEQSSPASITFDRWFVPGTGFVKELTVMRSPTGELLGRKTLELKSGLRIAPRPGGPEETPITASVSSSAIGPPEKNFSASVPNIYARWQGNHLPRNARVRALWIAEDVGDIAPKNYHVDQATTVASAPDAHGLFTLSRPDEGWAPGKYRVEFYVNDALVETVSLTIRPPITP